MASESFDDEHEAFAASRVSQYVFVPSDDGIFQQLDQHADTLEGDIQPPLVLVGNEGSGKSALLANWVSKRREHKHRDEFLFQHYVGCTSPSLHLLHTLFRLETALKDFFQLREMKVPDTEVELRWSLNRFLEAASKKHSPARIVIIIDGISRLKAEGAPDGALHWLPTELPPCVRFIVSTVELERTRSGKKEGPQHRTFVELARRQCPIVHVKPLVSGVSGQVVKVFQSMSDGFELNGPQQIKINACPQTQQPMYLRALLQALRLAKSLGDANLDEILEKLLSCATAHELIDRTLNMCCGVIVSTDGTGDDSLVVETLGKMMSVVYTSRSGLTEAEIWGLMSMVSKTEPEEEQKVKLMNILKEFTMVVKNMHTFSHEIYREVVYHKFISSRHALIRWHNVLARFFGQLPPCDRKLSALPYHLEMAGSWTKVKNCLTEIEMFQLWWTPKFKTDFIKFWSSLTAKQPANSESAHHYNKKGGSSGSNEKKKGRQGGGNTSGDPDTHLSASRPTFDIVEEYVKSLDEYRNQRHPSDEVVAGIILEIGDFLLEFATLGHEKAADVPDSVHPKILPSDLRALGVPHVDIDEDDRFILRYPTILQHYSNKQKADDADLSAKAEGPDGPGKAIDELPICTTYYFSRWMWIQYPYVSLGNCSARFIEGVQHIMKLKQSDPDGMLQKDQPEPNDEVIEIVNQLVESESKPRTMRLSASVREVLSTGVIEEGESHMMSKSLSSATMKLPQIKFNRKAARSVPRVNKSLEDEAEASSNKVQQRLIALQDNIQNYREEYDFLIQKKALVQKRLQEQKDAYVDLVRTASSVSDYEKALQDAIKRESLGNAKMERVLLINRNLNDLHIMCQRYPANVPALITELQTKLQEDEYILHEIKQRLWEQKCERQMHVLNSRTMKNLLKESRDMQDKILEYRYELQRALNQQQQEDERALLNSTGKQRTASPKRGSCRSVRKGPGAKGDMKEASPTEQRSWEETWSIISQRTGIIEPEAFFQRMQNSSALVEQINMIKKASEMRLESMKKEAVAVELELEEVRYEASFAGGVQSSKENKKQLGEKQQRLRQIKEKSEAMEQLEQKVIAGLAHISDILFIPKSEDDAQVSDLHKNIEAVLDTLINEREKQLQQQGQSQAGADNNSKMAGTRDSISIVPETFANRSPELDFVIAKHESPTVRLPNRLPSRPASSESFVDPSEDDDNDDEFGMNDRNYFKTVSLRRIAKLNRQEQKSPNLLATI